MFKYEVYCDCCDKPIPTITMTIDGSEVPCVDLAITKECDTRLLFPHLCKSCAGKIDSALLKMKTGMTHKRELCAKYAKINDERRERLGTKG